MDAVKALQAVNNIRLNLERKQAVSGVTCANVTKQSIGNRGVKNFVKASATLKDTGKIIEVLLPVGWQPVRIPDKNDHDLGTTGKMVATPSGGAPDVWRSVSNGQVSLGTREVLAWIAYFVEQLSSGSPYSAESTNKAIMLEQLIVLSRGKGGLTHLKVELAQDTAPTFEQCKYVAVLTIGNLDNLIKFCVPRIKLTQDVPDKESKRAPRKTRRVTI